MERTIVLTAVVHQEGSWFVAECAELGTVSQGTSFEDAVRNLKEATDLYLEEFGTTTPAPIRSWITTFESSVPVHA